MAAVGSAIGRFDLEAGMKRLVLLGALVSALSVTPAFAQGMKSDNPSLGSVNIAKNVMADGKPLAAGTYMVRLTTEEPKPGVGQTQSAERYVEFLKGGKVVGREVATVVPADEIGKIVKGAHPKPGGSVFQLLKGGDYGRVWINKGGTNYIINFPVSAA
jgi:hypothetical protein